MNKRTTLITATLLIATAKTDNTAASNNLLQDLQTLTISLANTLQTVGPTDPPESWHLGKNLMYTVLPEPVAYKEVVDRCGRIQAHVITPEEVNKIDFTNIPSHRAGSKYVIETRRTAFPATQNTNDRTTWASNATKCKTMSQENEMTRYRTTACNQPASAICVKHTINIEEDSTYIIQAEIINQLGQKLSDTANQIIEQTRATLALNPENPTTLGSWNTAITEANDEITATITALPVYPTVLQALTSTTATMAQVNKIAILTITYQMDYHATAIKVITDTIQSLAVQDILDVDPSQGESAHETNDPSSKIASLAAEIIDIQHDLGIISGHIDSHQHPKLTPPGLQTAQSDIQTAQSDIQAAQSHIQVAQSDIQVAQRDIQEMRATIHRLTTKIDSLARSRLAIKVRTLDTQVQHNLNSIWIIQNKTTATPKTTDPENREPEPEPEPEGLIALRDSVTHIRVAINKIGTCASCTVTFTAIIGSVGITIITLFIPTVCLYRKLSKKLTHTRNHLELKPPDSEQAALLPDLRSRMEGLERAHSRHLLSHTSLSDRHEDLRELIDNLVATKRGPIRRHQAKSPPM